MVIAHRAVSALLVLLCTAACGGGGDDPPPDTGTEEDAARTAQATRIVSLVPSLAELIVELGAADRLAARTDFDTHPAVQSLPSIGQGLEPSLEALVQLEADAVLMPEGRDMPALASRLEDIGIAAIAFRTETVEHLHESIARLGVLVDRRDEASALSAEIRERLAGVGRAVEGREPVPVMYVVWSDPPQTVAAGTYISEVIEIAGGRNVFADAPTRWPTVGFEAIVERAPEAIVWPRGASSERTLESVQAMAGWRDVRAVAEGRVVFVDADRFNRPGPDLPDAALELARSLHPEAFPAPGS